VRGISLHDVRVEGRQEEAMSATPKDLAALSPLSADALRVLKHIPRNTGIERGSLRAKAGIASLARLTAILKDLEAHGKAGVRTDHGRCWVRLMGAPEPPMPLEGGRSLRLGEMIDDLEAQRADAVKRRDATADELERRRLDSGVKEIERMEEGIAKYLEWKAHAHE
jgi:hypothetical protein